MLADADKRESECQAQGHIWRNEYNHLRACEHCYTIEEWNWLPPGTAVVHKHDSLWTGTVIGKSHEGIRVRREITDAQGVVHGSIECTFQPSELSIVEKVSTK